MTFGCKLSTRQEHAAVSSNVCGRALLTQAAEVRYVEVSRPSDMRQVAFVVHAHNCPLLTALDAARREVVDPRPSLGYGEENRVAGLLFEGRLGFGLMQDTFDGSERWRGPRQADDGW
jgi:hypothetical protein